MSFTDTEKHWLWGCAAATAESRSDVNVAIPHLRGKWSPTNAILRTLETSFMRQSLHSSRPVLTCARAARQLRMCHLSVNWGRTPVVQIPSFGRWFSRHPALPIRCGLAGAREGYSRSCSDRLHEPPRYPSVWLHPCRSRCCSTWLNHCTSHRDRRSDFEQPTGGGIGAVGVGSPCGYPRLFQARHHERPRWQAHPCGVDVAWHDFDAGIGK